MSLTAELFGLSAPSSTAAGVTHASGAPNATSVSFEPANKAAFDIFVLAPQVKKATRKEKQRLRLQEMGTGKKGTQKPDGSKERDTDNDVFKTVLLTEDVKEGVAAVKQRKSFKKHLRHALHENKEEDGRTVFVGNLVNDVKRRTIEKVFKNCGAIECVRVRAQAVERGEEEGFSKDRRQKSVGRAIRVLRGEIKKGDQYSAVAYVLFKDAASVTKALEQNGIIVDGRHIVVTAMDAESRAYAPETSVFIGNIAYDTNEEMVWNFFQEKGVGGVRRVRLIRDRDTGSCKGFGYVEFHTPASVSRAIAVRGTLLNGREVRIVHVQKSKAVTATKASRREKRKKEEQVTANRGHSDGGKNKRVRTEEKGTKRQANAEGEFAWMGVVTNPRKKIPKDLRPLVEGKRSRPPSGPRAPVKRKMRNPEK
ncbi:putative RNA binding protein [Trypanosoma rangeli]|uniref:Putative RNA binding protein n=1 Tax=Trypanosoma rangeli TaxID=5698 RepID=A0A3R7LUT6_TRYRA|nr:putative RNA binding protein [Trypanosoma rangeli]RNF03680.1 putative RNA binding protein [Trypanosoma rangeli]|eukprot:RNF03680.1 putative RNA binding protein [Trypanosoma rangeli]